MVSKSPPQCIGYGKTSCTYFCQMFIEIQPIKSLISNKKIMNSICRKDQLQWVDLSIFARAREREREEREREKERERKREREGRSNLIVIHYCNRTRSNQ